MSRRAGAASWTQREGHSVVCQYFAMRVLRPSLDPISVGGSPPSYSCGGVRERITGGAVCPCTHLPCVAGAASGLSASTVCISLRCRCFSWCLVTVYVSARCGGSGETYRDMEFRLLEAELQCPTCPASVTACGTAAPQPRGSVGRADIIRVQTETMVRGCICCPFGSSARGTQQNLH